MIIAPFQDDAIAAVFAKFSDENCGRRGILISPTGSGKTKAMGAKIASDYIAAGKRVLWVSPGPGLVIEAFRGLYDYGLRSIGVIASGIGSSDITARLMVSAIFTMKARNHWPAADLVIWDECHRSVAATWKAAFERYSSADHLGLTATPYAEGRDVVGLFDWTVVSSEVSELVSLGFIAPCDVYCPPEAEPSTLLEKYGVEGMASLVFCASHLDVAKTLSDLEGKIKAAAVYDKTPESERRKLYLKLEKGELDALAGVGTFVDGVDILRVGNVLFRHRLSSRRKAFQAIGRARRHRPGVTDGKRARAIDPLRGMLEHGMPDEAGSTVAVADKYICEGCYLMNVQNNACVGCGLMVEVGE